MAVSLKERALLGVVERAARSHGHALVLRGGLVTRRYVAPTPRHVDDVDFLGLEDADATRAALVAICASRLDDGLVYAPPTIRVIWEETELPGLRAQTIVVDERAAVGSPGADIDAGMIHTGIELQIDVGFGDPRVVPDRELAIDGTSTPMRVVAPETLYAWKLHGLFERGYGKWRAKDLFDLVLLGRRADLDEARLPECVRVAFASRGDALAVTDPFLHGAWGRSAASARKWRSYRRRGNDHAPEALGPVIDEARERARPLIERAARS